MKNGDRYPDYYPENVAGGPAFPADEDDIKRDQVGYTNLYLHRRINPTEKGKAPGELLNRQYKLQISGIESYRYIEMFIHDEDTEEVEIP